MNRKSLLDGIIHYLSILRVSVELHNSLNHQDINVVSENFFRDFLNLAFGYELKNINIVEKMPGRSTSAMRTPASPSR